MEIPTLQSERLRLRPPTLEDFADSYSMWSDPVTTRFIGGKPSTKQDTWSRLLRHIGHWHALGFGYWVVETKSDNRFIGEVGLSDFRRDIMPSLDGIPEIGWALVARAHGQNFASEAAALALTWRDRMLPPGETVCIIAPEHTASLRIAEKLEFGHPREAIYRGETTFVLKRPAKSAAP